MTKLPIMIDLETWGNDPGSSIASIGAVAFDPWGRVATTTGFYFTIDRKSCESIGLIENPETVAWWDEPIRAEARAALDVNPQPIVEVLLAFSDFYRSCALVEEKADTLWSNGPSYDESILGAAYRAAGLTPPWRYNAGRDCRVTFDIYGVKLQHTEGVFHHALDDAREQSVLVQDVYRRLLRGELPTPKPLQPTQSAACPLSP